MHPVDDVHLLWIARDALHASVPAPWVEGLDMRERLYYYNTVSIAPAVVSAAPAAAPLPSPPRSAPRP